MEYTEIELLSEYALSKNTTLSKLQNLADVEVNNCLWQKRTYETYTFLVTINQNKYVQLLSGDTKICCPSVFIHRSHPSFVRYEKIEATGLSRLLPSTAVQSIIL